MADLIGKSGSKLGIDDAKNAGIIAGDGAGLAVTYIDKWQWAGN
jgi:hypothetical protein